MTLRSQAPRIAAPTPTPELAAAAASDGGPHPPLSPSPASTASAGEGAGASELCPRCGERNPTESRFCHGCGSPLLRVTPTAAPPSPPQALVCARCRGVADAGADFCKFCGARLGAPPEPRPQLPVDLGAGAQPAATGGPANNAPVPSGVLSSRAVQTDAPARRVMPTPDDVDAARQISPHGATRPLHGIGENAPRARLVRIAKDGSEGGYHPVVEPKCDIGRTEGNILLADDPYLSPRHARIVVRESRDGAQASGLFLVDLGSLNGVFVRTRSPHPLVHGDLLLLGQQVLRFEAVTEIEGARGPAMQHGVLVFGSPAPTTRARLVQRTVEGLARDVIYITRDETVVGRESGDRTFPDDVFLSRRHAAFRREATGYVLHDLGSSNGTFVQIHAEHALSNGDQFRIGHHLFRIDFPNAGATGGGDA